MSLYDNLASDSNLSLDEVRLFKHVLKSNWPTDFIQLDTTLKVFVNLLSLVLNSTHPLNVSFYNLIASWSSLTLQLSERFNLHPAMPAQFLRTIQLHTSVYWQNVSMLTVNQARLTPAPDFTSILNSLLLQAWVAPSVPAIVIRDWLNLRY